MAASAEREREKERERLAAAAAASSDLYLRPGRCQAVSPRRVSRQVVKRRGGAVRAGAAATMAMASFGGGPGRWLWLGLKVPGAELTQTCAQACGGAGA